MSPAPLPALFLSHGSPMTALENTPATEFMRQLGPRIDRLFGRPRAILALSAHTLTREPVLLAAPRHEAVHDFGGFPDALYQLRYDTPGAPALAEAVARRLATAGLPAHVLPEGGLDHGIWTPLRFAYPAGDLPVLPMGFSPRATPTELFALGQALAPLAAEGVLVIASGSITHNLGLLARFTVAGNCERPEMAESRAFRDWFEQHSATRDWSALLAYRTQAPHAQLMHPTDEHLLPWYVAAGVGGRDMAPQRIHDSAAYGALGMDAYAFGTSAAMLLH